MNIRCSRLVGTLALLGLFMMDARLGQTYAAALDEAVGRYRNYLIEDIDRAFAGARQLRECIVAGDIECAKKAWISARGGWERSEVFTSGLAPELDEKIDTWPESTAGFHAIEAKLFGAKRTDVMTETDALIADLAELDAKLRKMPLPAQDLLNGVARLAYEVGQSKADGGESRFSGTSLDDMRNNVAGIEQAYKTIFAAALVASDPTLAAKTQAEIDSLNALLEGPSLKAIDPDELRKASEEFVVTLSGAAPKIGLRKPVLEDPTQ
ncbi:MAG: EfeM/EfeO family lipoprotein [Methylocella sp.]